MLLTKTQLHARTLRSNTTDAEKLLWQSLRKEQLSVKFRRQHPFAPYIVDFVCLERKLIVELDGGQHADKLSYDKQRDLFLQSMGYTVLRFWNNEVFENTAGVLAVIMQTLHPTPTLPAGGEGVINKGV